MTTARRKPSPRVAERLRRLRAENETSRMHSLVFLDRLLELSREAQDEDRAEGRSAGPSLTELFEEARPERTPIIASRIIADIEHIVHVVRLPGWKMTQDSERELRRTLHETLVRYQLHEHRALIERIMAYVAGSSLPDSR